MSNMVTGLGTVSLQHYLLSDSYKNEVYHFFFFFSSRRRHTRSVSAFLLNRSSDLPPNCMFSCLQILEAFLWFVLITLLNVTLIILTLSVSRLLNLLLRLVAFLLFLNPQ